MPKSPPAFRSNQSIRAKELVEHKERDRKREHDKTRQSSSKRGYGRRWSKYRLAFLRDNPLCISCNEIGLIEPATDVDHIIPHKGDMDLFWDPDNHQGLCKSCHSRKTATEDSSFASREGGGKISTTI